MEPRKHNQLSRIKVASVVIAAGCAIAVVGSSRGSAAPLNDDRVQGRRESS